MKKKQSFGEDYKEEEEKQDFSSSKNDSNNQIIINEVLFNFSDFYNVWIDDFEFWFDETFESSQKYFLFRSRYKLLFLKSENGLKPDKKSKTKKIVLKLKKKIVNNEKKNKHVIKEDLEEEDLSVFYPEEIKKRSISEVLFILENLLMLLERSYYDKDNNTTKTIKEYLKKGIKFLKESKLKAVEKKEKRKKMEKNKDLLFFFMFFLSYHSKFGFAALGERIIPFLHMIGLPVKQKKDFSKDSHNFEENKKDPSKECSVRGVEYFFNFKAKKKKEKDTIKEEKERAVHKLVLKNNNLFLIETIKEENGKRKTKEYEICKEKGWKFSVLKTMKDGEESIMQREFLFEKKKIGEGSKC